MFIEINKNNSFCHKYVDRTGGEVRLKRTQHLTWKNNFQREKAYFHEFSFLVVHDWLINVAIDLCH